MMMVEVSLQAINPQLTVLSVAIVVSNKPALVKCLSNESQIMKPALGQGHVYNTTVQDTDAC